MRYAAPLKQHPLIGLFCSHFAQHLVNSICNLTMYFIYCRRVKPELEINPRNHIHNPLYTSDYVPSTGPTSHHGNTQSNTTHEYDYVRVREPLSISVRNTRNTRNGDTVVNNHLFQDRARQVTSRLSIQNDSAIPLHYETMASYGNRIAHRVDTNSSTSSP